MSDLKCSTFFVTPLTLSVLGFIYKIKNIFMASVLT